MVKLISILAFTASALIAHADFSGTGIIQVWQTKDGKQAPPANKVGCLDNDGKFINPSTDAECGVFTKTNDYGVLSTSSGSCTFGDQSQETNVDSMYGETDHAWHCVKPYTTNVLDGYYTIVGNPHTYLCTDNLDCMFDAKRIPARGEKQNFWLYRWGFGQDGITPGHVQLQLVWFQK